MSQPGKPTIYNVPLTTSGTEYSQLVPEMISKIMIKCRTSSAIQFSWTATQSGTVFITIPANQTYWDDDIRTSGTIYMQSPTNAVVAELQVWSGA